MEENHCFSTQIEEEERELSLQWSLNNGFPIRKAILNLKQHLQKGLGEVGVVILKHNINGYSSQM